MGLETLFLHSILNFICDFVSSIGKLRMKAIIFPLTSVCCSNEWKVVTPANPTIYAWKKMMMKRMEWTASLPWDERETMKLNVSPRSLDILCILSLIQYHFIHSPLSLFRRVVLHENYNKNQIDRYNLSIYFYTTHYSV
jgi:hypothetical protein